MDNIDLKNFNIISTSIKSILNLAISIDDNNTLKNVSKEINNLLNSVEDDFSKSTITIKKTSQEIKSMNQSIKEIEQPPKVVKPLV